MSAQVLVRKFGNLTNGTKSAVYQQLVQYVYHTSEQYFSCAVIGQLGGDQPSTIHLRATEEKQNGFCQYIDTNKVTLWAASYSACVVYTKTISVGESGGYLPPLRCIIVNNIKNLQ